MALIRAISLLIFLNCVFAQQQSTTSISQKDIPPRCRHGHYFVSPIPVSSGESRSICKKYGGRLASINIENFEFATSLLFDCSGSQQRAWIGEWNGSDYNLNCLALYTGTGVPGGGVDTSCLSKKLPSICADPRGSYAVPPENANTLNAINATSDKGVDSSSATGESE
ncbi:hypothetical protein K501DRAFT_266290 [Backusella circina FSU 941]|nr:hypothetical protein K501DRAFT_266290 [Backusella circina FSU 941]